MTVFLWENLKFTTLADFFAAHGRSGYAFHSSLSVEDPKYK